MRLEYVHTKADCEIEINDAKSRNCVLPSSEKRWREMDDLIWLIDHFFENLNVSINDVRFLVTCDDEKT
jgi:hypothetical protein